MVKIGIAPGLPTPKIEEKSCPNQHLSTDTAIRKTTLFQRLTFFDVKSLKIVCRKSLRANWKGYRSGNIYLKNIWGKGSNLGSPQGSNS